MAKKYDIYILAGKPNGALYVGFTSDIIKRLWQHNGKFIDGFTTRYGVDKLIYFEQFDDSVAAIKREKRLKKYPRKWKLNLIEKNNPNWKDLYTALATGYPDSIGA